MAVIDKQLAPYFAGGSEKLAGSASGLISTAKGKLGSIVSDTGLKLIEKATPMLEKFVGLIDKATPTLSNIGTAVANGFGKVTEVVTWISTNFPKVASVFSPVTNAVKSLAPIFSTIFSSIGEKIKTVVGIVKEHMGLFRSIFELVSSIVSSAIKIIGKVISATWDVISPIIDIAISVFDALLSCVEKVFPKIQSVIEGVWGVLKGIFEGIADGLSKVGEGMSKVSDKIGGGVSWVKNKLGFAYGKDRVPYDNYPAILHEGEKILTRNQADQYERAMKNPSPILPKDTKSGNTVSIDRLADTIIIEKDADVDKVVAQMIAKFKKMVPNMA